MESTNSCLITTNPCSIPGVVWGCSLGLWPPFSVFHWHPKVNYLTETNTGMHSMAWRQLCYDLWDVRMQTVFSSYAVVTGSLFPPCWFPVLTTPAKSCFWAQMHFAAGHWLLISCLCWFHVLTRPAKSHFGEQMCFDARVDGSIIGVKHSFLSRDWIITP